MEIHTDIIPPSDYGLIIWDRPFGVGFKNGKCHIITRIVLSYKIEIPKMQTLLRERRVFLNLIIIVFFLSSLLASIVMAESTGEPTVSSEAKVHIIYTEKPTDEEPKNYHLRTLSSALGRFVLWDHSLLISTGKRWILYWLRRFLGLIVFWF